MPTAVVCLLPRRTYKVVRVDTSAGGLVVYRCRGFFAVQPSLLTTTSSPDILYCLHQLLKNRLQNIFDLAAYINILLQISTFVFCGASPICLGQTLKEQSGTRLRGEDAYIMPKVSVCYVEMLLSS